MRDAKSDQELPRYWNDIKIEMVEDDLSMGLADMGRSM